MAHCKLCNTNFSVAAGALYDVKRHTKRSTHVTELHNLFQTQIVINTCHLNSTFKNIRWWLKVVIVTYIALVVILWSVQRHTKRSTHVTAVEASSKTKSITIFVDKKSSSVILSETLFSNFVAEHNLPFSLADHFTKSLPRLCMCVAQLKTHYQTCQPLDMLWWVMTHQPWLWWWVIVRDEPFWRKVTISQILEREP
jgi:hypothetical protein